MSAPRGFPKNPLRDRPDPFRNSEGNNPFSEANSAVTNSAATNTAGGDNVYAAGASATAAEAGLPVEYEPWIPSRGGLLLVCTASALGLSALGFFLCGPLNLATLAFLVTVIVVSQKDLAAMRAGAMEKRRRWMTIAALWLAMLGSLATGLLGLWSIYSLYMAIQDL